MTREEAIKTLKELSECSYVGSYSGEDKEALDMAISALSENKGEWQLGGYDDMYYICSKCGFKASEYYAKPKFNFCPNCGADMRGE